MIVHRLKLAVIMCALIHAKMVTHALAMPNVKPKIIGPFAFVHRVSLVIHLQIASPKILWTNRNVPPILNVRQQHRVSISAAAILVPIVIPAPVMPNAVYHSIVHCAIVHWAGAAILKSNATDVSYIIYDTQYSYRTCVFHSIPRIFNIITKMNCY